MVAGSGTLSSLVSLPTHGHDPLGIEFEIGQVGGRCGACGQEARGERGTEEQHACCNEAADLEAVEERGARRVEQRVAGGTELV